jgi:hypothetical protein
MPSRVIARSLHRMFEKSATNKGFSPQSSKELTKTKEIRNNYNKLLCLLICVGFMEGHTDNQQINVTTIMQKNCGYT